MIRLPEEDQFAVTLGDRVIITALQVIEMGETYVTADNLHSRLPRKIVLLRFDRRPRRLFSPLEIAQIRAAHGELLSCPPGFRMEFDTLFIFSRGFAEHSFADHISAPKCDVNHMVMWGE